MLSSLGRCRYPAAISLGKLRQPPPPASVAFETMEPAFPAAAVVDERVPAAQRDPVSDLDRSEFDGDDFAPDEEGDDEEATAGKSTAKASATKAKAEPKVKAKSKAKADAKPKSKASAGKAAKGKAKGKAKAAKTAAKAEEGDDEDESTAAPPKRAKLEAAKAEEEGEKECEKDDDGTAPNDDSSELRCRLKSRKFYAIFKSLPDFVQTAHDEAPSFEQSLGLNIFTVVVCSLCRANIPKFRALGHLLFRAFLRMGLKKKTNRRPRTRLMALAGRASPRSSTTRSSGRIRAAALSWRATTRRSSAS